MTPVTSYGHTLDSLLNVYLCQIKDCLQKDSGEIKILMLDHEVRELSWSEEYIQVRWKKNDEDYLMAVYFSEDTDSYGIFTTHGNVAFIDANDDSFLEAKELDNAGLIWIRIVFGEIDRTLAMIKYRGVYCAE